MKVDKKDIMKLQRACNRNLELEIGRVNYNRVYKNKKAYSRKGKSLIKLENI